MRNTRLNQPPAQFSNEALANLTHFDIVVLDWLQGISPVLWDVAICPLCPPQESSMCVDGHDAWDDGDVDTLGANFVDPVQKDVHVVEHLGHDEGGAGIHLFFEVINELIDVVVVVAALRVARHANVEVVAVFLADIDDQVLCIAEASSSGLPLLPLAGRVSSEREYVCAAGLVGACRSRARRRFVRP
jgi:hypothetical protein